MSTEPTGRYPLAALLTLAAAIFVSTTCEFMPGGLIPLISSELSRPVSEVGLLVGGFAFAVVVSATPLTLLFRRVPRKVLLIGALGAFGFLNMLTAAAPNFETLLTARILGGAAHGLFFSVLFTYPAHLVPSSQLSRATAVTAMGGSLSGILGVPIGNALGQFFGWRASFAVFAVLIVLVVLLLVRTLPAIDHAVPLTSGEIVLPFYRDASLTAVLGLCALIITVVIGQVSFGTYSAVWLIDVARFPTTSIPLVLFLSGVSGAAGLVLRAIMPSRFPNLMFALSILIVLAALTALPLVASSTWAVLVLLSVYGIAFGGIPVMMQTRMMHASSARLRSFAASLQTTAFNVGISGGAVSGGLLIESIGLSNLTFGAASLGLVGLVIAVVLQVLERRGARKSMA